MSAWGTGIKQSDGFMDVYDGFFERYLRGVDPFALAQELYAEYLAEFDEDDVTIMPTSASRCVWRCGNAARAMRICSPTLNAFR